MTADETYRDRAYQEARDNRGEDVDWPERDPELWPDLYVQPEAPQFCRRCDEELVACECFSGPRL